MLEKFTDKIVISGVTVLMVGVALLIFTFFSAYGFLTKSLSIIASEDLVQTFGKALSPLVATCIRIMYLGVMGWIGSLLTIRGVTIMAHAPKRPKVTAGKQFAHSIPEKPKDQKTERKAKPPKQRKEVEPEEERQGPEPEVVSMVPQQGPQLESPPQKEKRENSSRPPTNS